jgi:hypothetical protein
VGAVATAVALAALVAGVARAELVRVESVGSVPLAAGSSGGASARQAALEAGVREAVERAAADLASQAGASASQDSVRAALGSDLLVYASQFRILEDRGERAPLLEQSPAAQREYVVTVETHVDRSRLRSHLQQEGLLGAPAQPGERRALRIAFDGVDSYPLWKRIERALAARGGAVRPLEFARGRIVAEVETQEEGGALVGRLGTGLGTDFEVRSVGMDGDTLLVAIAPRVAPEPVTIPDAAAVEAAPKPPTR